MTLHVDKSLCRFESSRQKGSRKITLQATETAKLDVFDAGPVALLDKRFVNMNPTRPIMHSNIAILINSKNYRLAWQILSGMPG